VVARTDSPRIVAPGSAEERAIWKNKRDNKLRLIKEIAASQLLQEELAKTDPNLVSVASFLSKVCGTDKDTRHLRETAGSLIREGGKEGVARTGAVTILSSELSTGYEGPAAAFESSGDSVVIPVEDEETDISEVQVNAVAEEARGINIPVVEGTIVSGMTLPGDNVMSVGSSTDVSLDHSTCGSSVSASESRKRTADESPDRDCDVRSRREFPGRVTRSSAGCRVYIPTSVGDEDEWPGRVLNPDGTIIGKVTLGQEGEAGTGWDEGLRGVDDVPAEVGVTPDEVTDEIGDVRALPTLPIPSSFLVAPVPALCSIPTETVETRAAFAAPVNVLLGMCPEPDMPLAVVVPSAAVVVPILARGVPVIDEWGRDTCVINEVCELIEEMPHPWSAYRAFEAAFARFPNIDQTPYV